MRLPFFSSQFVASLKQSAESNVQHYGTEPSWIEQFASGRQYVRESDQVVDPPPSLIFADDDNPKHDAANARLIYEWLSQLNPALAMEERLWAYLAHVTFANYMSARWPVDRATTIARRYLFEGMSFAALSRHGIARLWWAGFLTKEETRPNPYELTEALFMRQDVQVALMERSLGKCRAVRTAVLDFLRVNGDWFAKDAFGKRIQRLIRELNLLGGVAILDALPATSLDGFLERTGRKISSDGDSDT